MGNAGADPGDTHYSVFKLNIWFAISSVLLLLCVIWMVIDDYNREWKQWQRKFQQTEAQRLENLLKKYDSKEFVEEMSKLNQEIASATQSLAQRKSEIEKAQEELVQKQADRYKADQEQRVAKGDLDWTVYQVEEHRIHHKDDPKARQDEVDKALLRAKAAKEKLEQADKVVTLATQHMKSLVESRTKMEERLAAQTMERDRHARALSMLKPKTIEGKLAKGIRDMPGLDFAAPSLKVEKVVLDNLYFDLKFPGAKKRRVDMCMTCHVPIDRPGPDYAQGENPLKSHPRLDLFLSDNSPHPLKNMGCTVCHSGSGETLSFVHSDHAPRDAKQRKEWEEKYHWHKMHHWEHPMLPLQYTESSCYSCHNQHMEIVKEDAPKLYQAVELVEQAGCYGCHKIQQGPWQNLRKPGPSLTKIANKVSPDWAYAWIQKPQEFRPSTWMPQIFHLSNATDPTRKHLKVEEREDVAVNAIVEYLWDMSEAEAVPAPPVKGDAKRGAETIQLVGCFACHQVDGVNQANDWNDFGPDLSGIGSKLSENWLYHWVKDPKKYFPETRMPDLRLSEQEAADIAAYLATLKKEGWEPKRPQVDQELLTKLTIEYVNAQVVKSPEQLALKEAAEKGIADRKKMMKFVGEKFIARQGCFGCHEIKGFENATPIGTELSDWGSKDLDKLDFGNFLVDANPKKMEKARHVWAKAKLSDPRVFDETKIKQPDDLLKMPKFRLSPEEMDLVITFLMGLTRSDIPPQSMPKLTPAKETLAEGSFLIRRNNCESCHVFEYEKVTFKHPEDGVTSVRGSLRYDEDEESYWVQLREMAPSFAGDGKAAVGSNVEITKDAFLGHGPRIGGGLFASLEKQAQKSYTLLDEKGQWQSKSFSGVELEPFAPPSLVGEGNKVQADWLYQFLRKPYTIRPQVRVKMPSFDFNAHDAAAISQWFVRREEQRYPAEFTRAFRASLGMTRAQFAKECKIGRDAQDAKEILERLESGARVGADVFKRVKDFAKLKGFRFDATAGIPFDPVAERFDENFAARKKEIECGSSLVNAPSEQGGGACYTCHWKDGKPQTADPFTWAPDLEQVHERLRADWLRHWLLDPSQVIPNTKMPKPGIDSEKSGELCPNTNFAERVEAIKDYLLNYDRVHSSGGPQ